MPLERTTKDGDKTSCPGIWDIYAKLSKAFAPPSAAYDVDQGTSGSSGLHHGPPTPFPICRPKEISIL